MLICDNGCDEPIAYINFHCCDKTIIREKVRSYAFCKRHSDDLKLESTDCEIDVWLDVVDPMRCSEHDKICVEIACHMFKAFC